MTWVLIVMIAGTIQQPLLDNPEFEFTWRQQCEAAAERLRSITVEGSGLTYSCIRKGAWI